MLDQTMLSSPTFYVYYVSLQINNSEFKLIFFFQNEAGSRWSVFYEEASNNASNFNLNNILNNTIKLQLQSLQDKGSSVLSPEKYSQVSSVGFLCDEISRCWLK